MTATAPSSQRRRTIIDGMQFARWSRTVFEQMHAGGVSAVHVTVAYHENFRDTVDRLIEWNDRFRQFSRFIAPARTAADIDAIASQGKTAILFGAQNPSPMEADLGLLEILRDLGLSFMQLSYNNQSPFCGGWLEQVDSGLTNMGREAIREMNRLGMIVDMSHSAERSTLEAIEFSERPIVVSHANPSSWRKTARNKSMAAMKALADRDGLVGLSLYPEHLKDGPQTTLEAFSSMAAALAEAIGPEHIGIGSDLCQDQPPGVLAWMRDGKWRRPTLTEVERPSFPNQPSWFRNNLDFQQIEAGLRAVGFAENEIDGVLGGNWRRFLDESLMPQGGA